MRLHRIVLLTLSLSAQASLAQPNELLYRDFLKYSSTSRQDKELQAFLGGIAYAIRSDYVCNDRDQDVLRNTKSVVEELISFGKTGWGIGYASQTGQMGVARMDMTVGDVMLKVFTQHARCQPLGIKREQLSRQ